MKNLVFWLRRGLLLIVPLGLLAVGCIPIRIEASWPALSTIGANGDILMAYNDRVVIVDPEDGSLMRLRNTDGEVRVDEEGNARIWEFTGADAAPNQFFSIPVLLDTDTLLIPAHTQRMYEVSLSTARPASTEGETLPGLVVSDPSLGENLFYLGIERNLVAFDTESLDEQWRVETGQGVWSQPLVLGDTLYFTSLDHFLYALNAATGEQRWKLDLQGAAPEAPILHENRLYVGSFARKIFEVSLNGEILSEYATQDWVWGAPSIADNVLYAADASGMVYALNLTGTGLQERWAAKVSDRTIRTTPLVDGEYVVVGSRDQKVYWLDRTDGSIFFSREVAGEVLSDLLLIEADAVQGIEESLVIVGTLAPQEFIVAFTLQNGERTWSYGR